MAKWEEYLKKGAFTAGTALEKLIGHAGKIASNVKGPSTSAQPVLSLEGQLTLPKLKEIISQASDKTIAPGVPTLVDRTALELREGPSSLAKVFKERGASIAMHVDMGGSAGSYGKADSGLFSIRSSAINLPFEDGFFDFVAGVFSNQYQGDILKGIKEFSRVLSISGEGVIVDFHPFGFYAKRGSLRLKPVESTLRGVEDYFKICKSASLKITAVKESFIDESLRSMFVSEEEKSSFRIVKDTPLLIYLYVRKGV